MVNKMARYIDADALIEHLKDNIQECGNPNLDTEPRTYGCVLGLKSVLRYAEALPTAEVVEVRHGEWIDDGNCFHCSDCGKTYQLGSLQTIYDVKRCWTYCATCGAKMDGKVVTE